LDPEREAEGGFLYTGIRRTLIHKENFNLPLSFMFPGNNCKIEYSNTNYNYD
jgi:hypothetical protein